MLKTRHFILTTIIFLLLSTFGIAQHSLKGTVTNMNGETLRYASVFLDDGIHGVTTDEEGVFELFDIKEGQYVLKVTYLSYVPFEQVVDVPANNVFSIVLEGDAFQLSELEIIANRVSVDNPIAHNNINRTSIESNDFGQDVPVLLQSTPSLVMTSDAGNGIGYTSMRIRGFDLTRINVNINGVPLNDAESQAVFFVDIPDLLSSTEDIQVQRGVGSSTNGPGAFGASVSLSTKRSHINPYAELGLGYGSYNTKQLSGSIGTGLMNDKYAVDFRYSLTNSDGYLDRASADLNSYYLSASRFGKKSSIRFISFSGHEVTYQAWNGTPKQKLYGTEEELLDHYNWNKGDLYKTTQDSINLFSSDRKYNKYTYKNQVDDYIQTHYQLHYTNEWNSKLSTKAAVYSSLGKGYYEEFKYQDKFSNYLLPVANIEGQDIERGDIVRRRSLNNVLYGMFVNTVLSINELSNIDFGIAGSLYKGDHYGKVISAEHQNNLDVDKKYYESTGDKNESSTYIKYNWKPLSSLGIFLDLQGRYISYKTIGTDNDQQNFDVDESFIFFNPKLGLSYKLQKNHSLNLFVGMSNREPSRNDFVDVVKDAKPKHEQIQDYELSYRYGTKNVNVEINTYFMNYQNQLVLRGDLNDVGASIRVNVDKSYRTGVELSSNVQWGDRFMSGFNLSFSESKIDVYEEHISGEITSYKDTDIAYSPNVVSNVSLGYKLKDNWNIHWDTRYVSEQFIDNTSSAEKTIPAYIVSDLMTNYLIKSEHIKQVKLAFRISNLFNKLYASNAYTYSYIWGDKVTETFYFPQAERNYSLSMKIKF